MTALALQDDLDDVTAALDDARLYRLGEISRVGIVYLAQLGEAAARGDMNSVRVSLAQICPVILEARDLDLALGKPAEADLERR